MVNRLYRKKCEIVLPLHLVVSFFVVLLFLLAPSNEGQEVELSIQPKPYFSCYCEVVSVPDTFNPHGWASGVISMVPSLSHIARKRRWESITKRGRWTVLSRYMPPVDIFTVTYYQALEIEADTGWWRRALTCVVRLGLHGVSKRLGFSSRGNQYVYNFHTNRPYIHTQGMTMLMLYECQN